MLKTLQYADTKTIYTYKLTATKYIIADKIHSTQSRNTNYIERKNIRICTQLKRLRRRTICFSKNVTIIAAYLAIFFDIVLILAINGHLHSTYPTNKSVFHHLHQS